MKVFVSSVISGFESYRKAVCEAVESLGYTVIKAEDFNASPSSPRVACLDGVRAADAYILICGERYGDVQDSGYSATHEEYIEAKKKSRVFALIQQGVQRDNRQADFVDEVRRYATGHFTGDFSSEADLKKTCTTILHRWTLSNAGQKFDADEAVTRANSLVGYVDGNNSYNRETRLQVIVVGGPPQAVIRPSELVSDKFRAQVNQLAVYGSAPIFLRSEGTEEKALEDRLLFKQQSASLLIDEMANMSIMLKPDQMDGYRPVIIHEDIVQKIAKALEFSAAFLEMVDRGHSLGHVVVAVALINGDNKEWRTRAEDAQNNNSFRIGMGQRENLVAFLRPAHMDRMSLSIDIMRNAEDFAVKLKQQYHR